MNKKTNRGVFAAIFCLYILLLSSACFAKTTETVRWRLDAPESNTLPRNFRFMTDEFINAPKVPVCRQGLDKLRCSASAEFSGSGLSSLKEKLIEKAGKDSAIYIVDLRKESHGFINGEIAVSGHVERNWGNYNLTGDQTLEAEKKLLKSIIGKTITFIPMGNADTKLFGEITATVEKAQTEEEIIVKNGLRYKRIPVSDQTAPKDEEIDNFIMFYKTLPKNAWLHFHCHAGHGRTTSFAVFYDILKNPDVSLDDIVARQYALGGTNLFNVSDKDDWRSKETKKRAAKARMFYKYAKENRASNFEKPFSKWMKER